MTIRNAIIRGFKVAIYAEDAPGLTIENCDVSNNYRQHLKSTPEKEDESDWLYGHENDNNEWLRYGAGIYLLRCDGATVKNCRARNGQNGICLVRCNDATVVGCDMSFMSGWGLAMWRSNRCKVIGNRFDYCVRGYSHGVYARGQDSTGILVYEQCSDNVFAYNHATHGGDGFFLYAGNETVNKTGEGGCNRNLVYMNDFSHAVANGIEATFSDGNMFRQNVLSHCVHGLWGGYSKNSEIIGNYIEDCDNGISIEHGRDNNIEGNDIRRCTKGVNLWWDKDRNLAESEYAYHQGEESRGENLKLNLFEDCHIAFIASSSTDIIFSYNRLNSSQIAIRLKDDARCREVVLNAIDTGLVDNQTCRSLSGMTNLLAESVTTNGSVDLVGPPMCGMGLGGIESKIRSVGQPTTLLVQDPRIERITKELGKRTLADLVPILGIPEGKEHIIVTEWGPWDFTGERRSRSPTTRPAESR